MLHIPAGFQGWQVIEPIELWQKSATYEKWIGLDEFFASILIIGFLNYKNPKVNKKNLKHFFTDLCFNCFYSYNYGYRIRLFSNRNTFHESLL
jgi:hypothetical protein